jgi:hypothetical protein
MATRDHACVAMSRHVVRGVATGDFVSGMSVLRAVSAKTFPPTRPDDWRSRKQAIISVQYAVRQKGDGPLMVPMPRERPVVGSVPERTHA